MIEQNWYESVTKIAASATASHEKTPFRSAAGVATRSPLRRSDSARDTPAAACRLLRRSRGGNASITRVRGSRPQRAG
jgi:hypothetical protein